MHGLAWGWSVLIAIAIALAWYRVYIHRLGGELFSKLRELSPQVYEDLGSPKSFDETGESELKALAAKTGRHESDWATREALREFFEKQRKAAKILNWLTVIFAIFVACLIASYA